MLMIIGGWIYVGDEEWNMVRIINEWRKLWGIVICTGVVLMRRI